MAVDPLAPRRGTAAGGQSSGRGTDPTLGTGPSPADGPPSDAMPRRGKILRQETAEEWATRHPSPPVSTRLFPVGQEQMTTDDYYTPPWVFDAMALRFDLDVAAPPGGVDWIPADRFYTQADDGLAQPWNGRVWMNPPFSNSAPWVRRYLTHRDGIALLPLARTNWLSELWAEADGIALPNMAGSFKFVGGWPFLGVLFAAFGAECVDAIARVGTVRRVG